jgi:hypothetical protein
VVGASLRREREKRDSRLDLQKSTRVGGGELRDLDQVRRRGLGNDGAIGEDVLAPVVGKLTRKKLETLWIPSSVPKTERRPQHVAVLFRLRRRIPRRLPLRP